MFVCTSEEKRDTHPKKTKRSKRERKRKTSRCVVVPAHSLPAFDKTKKKHKLEFYDKNNGQCQSHIDHGFHFHRLYLLLYRQPQNQNQNVHLANLNVPIRAQYTHIIFPPGISLSLSVNISHCTFLLPSFLPSSSPPRRQGHRSSAQLNGPPYI